MFPLLTRIQIYTLPHFMKVNQFNHNRNVILIKQQPLDKGSFFHLKGRMTALKFGHLAADPSFITSFSPVSVC